jgi:hypothetical protein
MELQKFMETWARDRGIIFEDAELRASKKGGYGLFTTCNTEKRILFVPFDQLLSLKNCGRYIDAVHFPIDEKQALILIFLLLRTSRLPGYEAYLSHLPAEVDYPLTWEKESIEYLLLEGTGMEIAFQAKEHSLQQAFDKLKGGFTLEDYIWAEHMVSSRSMESPIDSSIFVCPILDFCNHSERPNAFWQPTHDGIELLLNGTVGKDTELVISYGPKSNSELFFSHGFILAENPIEQSSFLPPFFELQDHPATIHDVDSLSVDPAVLCGSVKDKKELALQLGFDSIISLQPPDNASSIVNPSKGAVGDLSLATMYLCMLTSEQGFKKNNGTYELNGVPINRDNFLLLCKENPFYDIVSLQVWSILVDMVSQRIDGLSQEMEDEIKGINPNVSLVELYRQDQCKSLQKILPVLEELQSSFVDTPIVQSYLSRNQ